MPSPSTGFWLWRKSWNSASAIGSTSSRPRPCHPSWVRVSWRKQKMSFEPHDCLRQILQRIHGYTRGRRAQMDREKGPRFLPDVVPQSHELWCYPQAARIPCALKDAARLTYGQSLAWLPPFRRTSWEAWTKRLECNPLLIRLPEAFEHIERNPVLLGEHRKALSYLEPGCIRGASGRWPSRSRPAHRPN